MSTKLEYLKRYGKSKKKGSRGVRKSNFCIIDDDVNWKADLKPALKYDEDPEEAPLVAGVKDESVLKWQPLSAVGEEENSGTQLDLNPAQSHDHADLSPPRRVQGTACSKGDSSLPIIRSDDFSPPRKKASSNSEDLLSKGSIRRRHKQTHDKSSVNSESGRMDVTSETVYRKGNNSRKDNEDSVSKNDEEFMQWGRGYI